MIPCHSQGLRGFDFLAETGEPGRSPCLEASLPISEPGQRLLSRSVTQRPLILVSNDDGFDAVGCVALRLALSRFADVVTVAPRYEQSAKSHAISLHHPLRHQEHETNVHSVDGTPADCVYVALFREDLLPRRPDLVASGINHGPNLGSDVHYSGTVAAAREGALRGIPSIAFSSMAPRRDFESNAELAAIICERVLQSTMPTDQVPLLNVNFPEGPVAGVIPTRLGTRIYAEGVEVRDDPRGREYYWIGSPGAPTHGEVSGSDTDAVDRGYASITPISIDTTRASHVGLAQWASTKETTES
jgi:5'-nucleotidase